MSADRRSRADGAAPIRAPGRDGTRRSGRSPVEVELKYLVRDAEALAPLLAGERVAGMPAGAPRTVVVEDRYVDTAGRGIQRGGYAARLREIDGRVVLDLKSLGRASASRRRGSQSDLAALHRRNELEGPANGALDPEGWPESEARALLLELTSGELLAERFRLRQSRREREVGDERGHATMTVDDVQVVRDGETLGSYTALEAEMQDGDESILARLASALEATGLVEPAGLSKFEHAARLVEGLSGDGSSAGIASDAQVAAGAGEATAGASDAEPALAADIAEAGPRGGERPRLTAGRTPGVQATDTLAEAGRKVLRFHLARMLAREAGTRSGKDPEDLHSMRVATRRMRAAWRVFGDAYRPAKMRRYVAELRTLAAALGRVRDLDVLIDGADAYAGALPEEERDALRPLVASWHHERDDARDGLVRMLDSDAYRRFVDDYVELVRTEGAAAIAASATDPHRVRDTAGSRLWASYESIRAYDAVLRWADIATLHQLRITGKRLRYTLEFFREPLGPDATILIERVTALQDHLGAMHDADVAAGLARGFLVAHSARLAPAEIDAIGRYLTSREREVTRLRRSLGPVWRRLVALGYRRALGRAVGRL
jgi:CHAD domain-containing protein